MKKSKKSKSKAFYQSPEWKKQRAEHLEKFPACASCGVARPKGMVVHHRDGLKKSATNLMTLCYNCHSILEAIFRRKGNLKQKHVIFLWKEAKHKWTLNT